MTSDTSEVPVRFARSGSTDPFGKLDSEVKVALPEDVRDKVAALAAMAGMPVSEYVRGVVYGHVFGEFGLMQARCHGRRSE